MSRWPMQARTTPLVLSRRRDTARRGLQVHNAIAQLRADRTVVTVSSVARAARVHRSFIHRHPDLHAAVIAAAEQPAEPVPSNSATSVASLRADLLNIRAQNNRPSSCSPRSHGRTVRAE